MNDELVLKKIALLVRFVDNSRFSSCILFLIEVLFPLVVFGLYMLFAIRQLLQLRIHVW